MFHCAINGNWAFGLPFHFICPLSPHTNSLFLPNPNSQVKGKKGKKGKMQKVDARILGFNTTAAPDRLNVGKRDYGDGTEN